ncbi:hypothetical protein P8452_34493 [Trifolium repens]|nr:hypothetical protein P8452_34493 [Trifolium repens]
MDSDSNHKRPFPHNSSPISASVVFNHFELPLFSATENGVVSICKSMRLHADQPYSIGRKSRDCEFIFNDRRVSKRHCQILFDGSLRKLYILSGVLSHTDSTVNSKFRIVHEFRKRVMVSRGSEGFPFLEASNGVFVNGVEIRKGMAVELYEGDRVSLVCGNQNCLCGIRNRIGFVVERIVVENCHGDDDEDDEIDRLTFSGHSQSGKRSKRVFAVKANDSKFDGVVGRARFLVDRCRDILLSDDPLSCILPSDLDLQCGYKRAIGTELAQKVVEDNGIDIVQSSSALLCESKGMDLEENGVNFCPKGNLDVDCGNNVNAFADKNLNLVVSDSIEKDNVSSDGNNVQGGNGCNFYPPPGKNFYLNRLEFMNHDLSGLDKSISLNELIHPIESATRMFIATFTSDIPWWSCLARFLTYCKIPLHLPVTIACQNTEKCWSSKPDERVSVPYHNYPNLVVVHPPFPETIAFGKDRKGHGIACHHPKLIVLQREDSIRVVITSSNLVEKQWNNVTNTIWWQDFPRAILVDFASLFPKIYDDQIHRDSKCDFAAQLAGFMASLVIDVPSQAHWITQLTKYDFGGATGHLVASVPGVHLNRTSVLSESYQSSSFLGSVVASVVGLSHLFRTVADSNGAGLKSLAAILGKSCNNAYGRFKIVLRRNHNVPADENAVSVLVPKSDQTSEGDYVQLGFLPRNVAKWVSPLWDAGFFAFSGYVCPKEALAAALGENCQKVQLMLNVSEGHHFQDMSKMMQSEQIAAFCSLIALMQRHYGLWRLQEVLNQYRWPESLKSEIVYGASSIGSVNSKFLAAFSAAAGKKSLQHFVSEESDPEWGCWNAREELKNPSVKIIFPTIQRVKNAYNGILPSRRILCFSERTWQRLKTLDVLHDAIPHSHERVGHPMHTKVVRRCFWSRKGTPSFGWVYCGSHDFSAAAWGRQISNPSGTKTDGPHKGDPSVNSGLHICNYELGIIFTFPPKENNDFTKAKSTKLDDIILPFVVPAPKYGSQDRPATKLAMREAMTELAEREGEKQAEEEMMEEILEEEEEIEEINCVGEEKEEEKAYADILWSQVDSSHSQDS